jgi:hypothetical protein
MSSEYIVCPNCKTMLKKPMQYQVISEALHGDGHFIALGGSDSIPCGVCGFQISKQDILTGKCDPQLSEGSSVGIVIAIAIVVFIMFQCSR